MHLPRDTDSAHLVRAMSLQKLSDTAHGGSIPSLRVLLRPPRAGVGDGVAFLRRSEHVTVLPQKQELDRRGSEVDSDITAHCRLLSQYGLV